MPSAPPLPEPLEGTRAEGLQLPPGVAPAGGGESSPGPPELCPGGQSLRSEKGLGAHWGGNYSWFTDSGQGVPMVLFPNFLSEAPSSLYNTLSPKFHKSIYIPLSVLISCEAGGGGN